MNINLLIIAILVTLTMQQSCTVEDPQKIDCGYLGIDQQKCEAKNCCWHPQSANGIPWCYNPSSDDSCKKLNFKADSPGFDQNFYNGVYDKYLQNLNVYGNGGIVAAPDNSSELGGGSYWYHWMRDGALTMRSYMEINDLKLEKIEVILKQYTQWVLKLQNQPDPYQIDIRIEPKYQLNDGTPYKGGWCRGQTDGPGLRATSLIMFANILLQNGQQDYIKQYLWTSDGSFNGGAIKYDLDWLQQNWQQDGCDLWEEVRDKDFFWNRMAFQYGLDMASDFATKMGNIQLAQTYKNTAQQIRSSLQTHWNGNIFISTNTRFIDGAVLHAIASFPGAFDPTDTKVAQTIKSYAQAFCELYQINVDDNKNGIPGILLGRYSGDMYFGGNPWQLLTAALAELFYKGGVAMLQNQQLEGKLSREFVKHWGSLLPDLKEGSSNEEYIRATLQAGDAVLQRIYSHIKSDNYKITEQIDKSSGKQISANYLTWSHANVLTALHLRNSKLVPLLELKIKQQKNSFLNNEKQ